MSDITTQVEHTITYSSMFSPNTIDVLSKCLDLPMTPDIKNAIIRLYQGEMSDRAFSCFVTKQLTQIQAGKE